MRELLGKTGWVFHRTGAKPWLLLPLRRAADLGHAEGVATQLANGGLNPNGLDGGNPTASPRDPGFALNQADIDEFKQITRQEFGVEMSNQDAWRRVIELLHLYRSLLGPIPEDPERPLAVRTSSHLPSGLGTTLPR